MRKRKIKILIIAGTRPNFVKIAPLIEEMKKHKILKPILIHTGQHYDFKMSKVFFRDLKIPKPDYNLKVGSGSHAYQIGEAMIRLEKVVLRKKPDLIVVVGDANPTLIGALVATKLNISVAHIEAGLRSFNKRMPEEINRILTDHISDYLFASEPSAIKNLLKEGIEKEKIFFVGNIMIDSLEKLKIKSKKLKVFEKLGLKKKKYIILTLHRPENIDEKQIFGETIEAIQKIQNKIKTIWPIHPQAGKQLRRFDFLNKIKKMKNLRLIQPLSYREMLSLIGDSRFVLTDSGGIQEETTVLRIPCLTIREVTERPITVEIGTNKIVGLKKENIIKESLKILKGKITKGKIPKYWDGRVARRIVKIISKNYGR